MEAANSFILTDDRKFIASLLAMSYDNRYLWDESGPLLLIGAFKGSLLSDRVELWMIATSNFKLQHIFRARKMLREWLRTQSDRITARTANCSAEQFLRYMGFVKVETQGEYTIYEVK